MAALALTVPAATPAAAASTSVVVSQVYGGGGNAGAPFTNDFIELFNRGSSPASVGGWSLQYASATGAGNLGADAGQLTELPDVTLAPGQYLLVQEAAGATPSALLPTPDVTDPTPIAMGATGGKVALVTGSTSLGCNGATTPCPPDALARIVDLVGYGNANFFDGTGPTPAPSNTAAAVRYPRTCADAKFKAGLRALDLRP
jgi:hypothetical protein